MDLLGAIGDTLGYVGDVADKFGGRALRGALGGHPDELASLLPFSDSLGITDPTRRVSGRDLTNQWGLTTEGDNSWRDWGLGVGAEMALDPLNLLGAGVFGKGAKGAKAAEEASGLAKAAAATNAGADVARTAGRADDLAGAAASLSEPRSLAHFLKDDTGALGLKYDQPNIRPEDFGLTRTDPEWVNNRTFYHGTNAPGLAASNLDPYATKSGNLFGQGIYTTDSLPISREYGDAAVNLRTDPSEFRAARDALYQKWKNEHGVGNVAYPSMDEFFQEYPHLKPQPQIYQAQSDFGKLLDLDAPAPKKLYKQTQDVLREVYDDPATLMASVPGFEAGAYVKALRDASNQIDPYGGIATDILRGKLGYDALTHTGGTRVGKGKTLHQVVIGLDPNDLGALGRTSPYKIWDKVKQFTGDEGGYLKFAPEGIPPELANAADALGPQYPGGPMKFRQMGDLLLQNPALMAKDPNIAARLYDLANSQHAAQLAGELPEGSSFFNRGAEALAFKTPEGGIVRIQDSPHFAAKGFRPADMQEMLQSYRTTDIGPYRVEHLPEITPLSRAVSGQPIVQRLKQRMNLRKLDPWDVREANVGMTPEGRALIFDPGAVDPGVKSGGLFEPGGRPGLGSNALVDRPTYPMPDEATIQRLMEMGGPEAVRGSLTKGIQSGTMGQGLVMDPDVTAAVMREIEQGGFRTASPGDLSAQGFSAQGLNTEMVDSGFRDSAFHGFDLPWKPWEPGRTPGSIPSATPTPPPPPSLAKILGVQTGLAGGAGLLAYLMSQGNRNSE